MPLQGTLDVTPRLGAAARMDGLGTEPLTLERVEILQAMFEIDSGPMTDVLPVALHPTIPPTITALWWHCPGGDLGEFTLAQVRVGSRAGARPRGYPVGTWITGGAGDALAKRWGFAAAPADVRLRRHHHQVRGTVEVNGRTILDVLLRDPEAIAGTDVQYTANMNLAVVDGEPLLVQVDPEYVLHKADRGHPMLQAFDAAACGDERLNVVYSVSASSTVCDVTLPKIRYVCDPARPAMQGTRKVG